MAMSHTNLDELCVNTLRMLSIDAVQKAKSGHPGLPLGAAPMAFVLWHRFLKHNPRNPRWPDRDRYVHSAGHGSALLYALLHLSGYDLSLEDLKQFRQWDSKTPGHPEHDPALGIECTTGPLGQGFGMGVGMALAERFLAATFNRPGFPVINHYTYGIVSDGDLMEGISSEAASLAGHLQLGKLIYLYDDNHISIEGDTAITFTEDVCARFTAYGWHVERVSDGNDLEAIAAAIEKAHKETTRPSLVIVRTHIGYGSPKQDSAACHGEPLGEDAVRATKQFFGWPSELEFYVPEQATQHFTASGERGKRGEEQWHGLMAAYRAQYPREAESLEHWLRGELPSDWDAEIPVFNPEDGAMATRVSSGKVLNAVAKRVGNLLGGSADLAPSTKTLISGSPDQSFEAPSGRNIRFGVREHAMGAIVNGMALHGGVIPYGATFLVFADYMRNPIRLSALMGTRSIWIFTHDSIAVGEDGPTHQPVEHVASLRAIPNLAVIRPADANETAYAWRVALTRSGPTALILTRQNLPTLDRSTLAGAEGLEKGAYVLADADGFPQIILIATGSEVSLALQAREQLLQRGIRTRVVSMPCWELFEEQPAAYRNVVLPPQVKARVAIEAGISMGWRKWVGDFGETISVETFGKSAPGSLVMKNYGFTVENVVETGLRVLTQ